MLQRLLATLLVLLILNACEPPISSGRITSKHHQPEWTELQFRNPVNTYAPGTWPHWKKHPATWSIWIEHEGRSRRVYVNSEGFADCAVGDWFTVGVGPVEQQEPHGAGGD